ncbi:MAG TPA: 2OG-Fe dioxygenase family protein [Stellaceae bacterium]|nr:2OG-Fe dioxygenase family protein [Stellaceae bacterium]
MSLSLADETLDRRLARDAYAFLAGAQMRPLLEAAGPLSDWQRFAASWNDMPVDAYMADGGRYRRRRHAVFEALPGAAILRAPHQPHYQSREYNPLHGGIERWFKPTAQDIGAGASVTAILGFCRALFERLEPAVRAWHIETHQFRIEARPGEPGKPTPEGLHRDGVDYVLVLLIRRQNIRRGTTTIHALDRRLLGSFTLADPFDAALVHDARVYHGVTPVEPIDPAAPAYRDVLVVTFRRK